MQKKILVLLAEGFEEVEAITPVDYLRRAGILVTVAAVQESVVVKGSHGIQVSADTNLKSVLEGEVSAWDGVVVPGGLPGSDNIAASKEACLLIKEIAEAGKLVSSLCAAPAVVLSPLGLLAGKKFTCYPGREDNVLSAYPSAEWKKDRVVVDGNLITSRSAGTAGEFACAIIDKLLGDGQGKKVSDKVLLF